MAITATELKENLGKYLELAATEDVCVTKNGKIIAVISSPNREKVEKTRSLFGVLPNKTSLDEARYEALTEKLGYEV